MYRVIQGQKERLRKDERGQYLDALLLSAKWRGHKDYLQRKSIGFNSSQWEPHFNLLSVGSTLWAMERGTLMSDRNIGEMFLNFMLSEEVRSLCGVDVTNMR